MPNRLSDGINTTYHEINPVISPDGNTLFFGRVDHPSNSYGPDSQDIWFSTRVNDSTWTEALRVPKLNVGRYNAVLAVSADGNTLLLNGVYNKNGNIWKKRGLSISTRQGEEWSSPKALKVKKLSKRNKGEMSSATMSPDASVLVLSFSKAYNGKKNNLYVSSQKKNGNYRKPKSLSKLNTGASEEAPFLSADGKTLYFARGKRDKFDVYKATRTSDKWNKWTKPVKLSDTVNTSGWESYFKLNMQGSWAYYSSTNSGSGNADVYTIKLFEENPYVLVKGRVINGSDGQPLKGREFKITANGNVLDSLKISDDGTTFEAKLKLGEKYVFDAQLDNFTSKPAVVDVTAVKEFTTRDITLELTSLPYVLVKGRLAVENTGAPIDPSFSPVVYINNTVVDSLTIDPATSTYEVKLKFGTTYDFKVQAKKHEPGFKTLDLSTVNEFQLINHDLYVSEEKSALITGVIRDNKTGTIMSKLAHAKLVVQGLETVPAVIDTLTGKYELHVPLNASYTISVSAPGYYPVYETIDVTGKEGGYKVYRDLIVAPIEVGQSIRLKNIFFDPAKTILKPESYSELDRVAEFLQNNPEMVVEISGHTDNVGKAATNLKLSQGRAQAVADYIAQKGIPKERVVAKGYGSTKPVASNTTAEGKAENRRVEFKILEN